MKKTTNEKAGREKHERSVVPMPIIDVINEIMKPVPEPVEQEPQDVRKELLSAGEEFLVPIMRRMAAIACDESQKASDAIKAADFVYNRVLGAPTIKSSHQSFNVDLGADHLAALASMSKPFIEITSNQDKDSK